MSLDTVFILFKIVNNISKNREVTIKIVFVEFLFDIVFEQEITLKKFPVFSFRSVLGKELYKLSCVLRTQKCESCPLNTHCVYSQVFTTPVTSNEIFKGNKKPHPFILGADFPLNQPVQKGKLNFLLIGETTKFFPYIFAALKSAGEHGIFKDRVKFRVEKVFANGKLLNLKDEKIDLEFKPLVWELDGNKELSDEKVLKIDFLSPVKIERKRKIVRNLTYRELIMNGLRRLKLLSYFYGENYNLYVDVKNILDNNFSEESNLTPVSLRYYSFRQKKAVYMKGMIGNLIVQKGFSPLEQSLLKGLEIFNLGKATSFGFGKIKIDFQ